MKRCFDLAKLGFNKVSPNPAVGAVLVHDDKIIGEGYHKKYGSAHAEVNALANVKQDEEQNVTDATLFVSLEPCNVHGNTPPCTDLIINNSISNLVISTIDKSPGVDGKGISQLESKGVNIKANILAEKGNMIAAIRNTYAAKKRPYIILKWAQSKDGFIGKDDNQVWLSNSYSKRLTHKWRSEADAILIGTKTALLDNPKLTTRLWPGSSPLRIVLDLQNKIPSTHALKDGEVETWIITKEKPSEETHNLKYIILNDGNDVLELILDELYKKKKSSLIVEGGAKTLAEFVQRGLWDEMRILNADLLLHSGVKAPEFATTKIRNYRLGSDTLKIVVP